MSEPKESGQVTIVRISVLRIGDTSKVSVVRVHTKDGSATSGEDYHPISEGTFARVDVVCMKNEFNSIALTFQG